MKCPTCQFTCSDLRDICPKCKEDLREFKASLGLPISYPERSYNEILSQAGSAEGSLSERGVEPRGLLKTLQGLFQEEALTPVMEQPSEVADSPPKSSPATPPPTTTPTTTTKTPDENLEFEIDLGEEEEPEISSSEMDSTKDATEETFDFAFGELEVDEPDQETPPVKEATSEEPTPTPLELKEDLQMEVEEPSPTNAFEDWLSGGHLNVHQPFHVSKERRFPSLAPQRVMQSPEPLPQIEDLPLEEDSQVAPQKEERPPPPPPVSRLDIQKGFSESMQQLPIEAEDEFEISAAGVVSEKNRETVELLFQVASESFVDKSIEKRFQETGRESTSREVKSEVAAKRLEQAEEALKAPVFKLTDAPSTKDQKDEEPTWPVHQLATTRERIMAWLYDVLFLFGLGAVGGLAISLIENDSLTTIVALAPSPLAQMASVYVLGNILAATLFTFLIYPLLSQSSSGGSFGAKFQNCRLYRPEQKKPASLGHHYTRHLLLPISTILSILGFFPTFLKGRSAADLLSGTTLCSELRLEETEQT